MDRIGGACAAGRRRSCGMRRADRLRPRAGCRRGAEQPAVDSPADMPDSGQADILVATWSHRRPRNGLRLAAGDEAGIRSTHTL